MAHRMARTRRAPVGIHITHSSPAAGRAGCPAPTARGRCRIREAQSVFTLFRRLAIKTVGRIPGSTLPSAIATGWGVYQSTS